MASTKASNELSTALSQTRAAIIDLDGTLLDTAADLAAAANAIRVDLNMAPLRGERIATFVGKGADVLVHRTLTDDPDGRVDDALFAKARPLFDIHYARENGRWAKPFPGVPEGLAMFQARGIRLVCVTNKPQVFADPLLAQHGMANYFELILGGDALPAKKPDPLPLTHAAGQLGLTVADCLMIGDSLNDALAARAAGMPVLILPYGYNEGRDVNTIDCDGIVASLADIANAVGQSSQE